MAGPAEDVHGQCGRVGQLEEEDLVSGNLRNATEIRAARENVEAVEAGPDPGVVGGLHEVPGVVVFGDEPAPGQSFVGDIHAMAVGQVAEATQLFHDHAVVGDGGSPDVRAQQDGVDPEPGHELEFRLCPLQVLLKLRLVDALEVPEGLVQIEADAKIGSQLRDGLGGGGGDDEVLFEDLDSVEAGPCCGPKLLFQSS